MPPTRREEGISREDREIELPIFCSRVIPTNRSQQCDIRHVVYCFLMYTHEEGDMILLVQRGYHESSFPGRWGGISGGIEKDDKNAYEAALREIEEEAGIERSSLKLKMVGPPSYVFVNRKQAKYAIQAGKNIDVPLPNLSDIVTETSLFSSDSLTKKTFGNTSRKMHLLPVFNTTAHKKNGEFFNDVDPYDYIFSGEPENHKISLSEYRSLQSSKDARNCMFEGGGGGGNADSGRLSREGKLPAKQRSLRDDNRVFFDEEALDGFVDPLKAAGSYPTEAVSGGYSLQCDREWMEGIRNAQHGNREAFISYSLHSSQERRENFPHTQCGNPDFPNLSNHFGNDFGADLQSSSTEQQPSQPATHHPSLSPIKSNLICYVFHPFLFETPSTSVSLNYENRAAVWVDPIVILSGYLDSALKTAEEFVADFDVTMLNYHLPSSRDKRDSMRESPRIGYIDRLQRELKNFTGKSEKYVFLKGVFDVPKLQSSLLIPEVIDILSSVYLTPHLRALYDRLTIMSADKRLFPDELFQKVLEEMKIWFDTHRFGGSLRTKDDFDELGECQRYFAGGGVGGEEGMDEEDEKEEKLFGKKKFDFESSSASLIDQSLPALSACWRFANFKRIDEFRPSCGYLPPVDDSSERSIGFESSSESSGEGSVEGSMEGEWRGGKLDRGEDEWGDRWWGMGRVQLDGEKHQTEDRGERWGHMGSKAAGVTHRGGKKTGWEEKPPPPPPQGDLFYSSASSILNFSLDAHQRPHEAPHTLAYSTLRRANNEINPNEATSAPPPNQKKKKKTQDCRLVLKVDSSKLLWLEDLGVYIPIISGVDWLVDYDVELSCFPLYRYMLYCFANFARICPNFAPWVTLFSVLSEALRFDKEYNPLGLIAKNISKSSSEFKPESLDAGFSLLRERLEVLRRGCVIPCNSLEFDWYSHLISSVRKPPLQNGGGLGRGAPIEDAARDGGGCVCAEQYTGACGERHTGMSVISETCSKFAALHEYILNLTFSRVQETLCGAAPLKKIVVVSHSKILWASILKFVRDFVEEDEEEGGDRDFLEKSRNLKDEGGNIFETSGNLQDEEAIFSKSSKKPPNKQAKEEENREAATHTQTQTPSPSHKINQTSNLSNLMAKLKKKKQDKSKKLEIYAVADEYVGLTRIVLAKFKPFVDSVAIIDSSHFLARNFKDAVFLVWVNTLHLRHGFIFDNEQVDVFTQQFAGEEPDSALEEVGNLQGENLQRESSKSSKSTHTNRRTITPPFEDVRSPSSSRRGEQTGKSAYQTKMRADKKSLENMKLTSDLLSSTEEEAGKKQRKPLWLYQNNCFIFTHGLLACLKSSRTFFSEKMMYEEAKVAAEYSLGEAISTPFMRFGEPVGPIKLFATGRLSVAEEITGRGSFIIPFIGSKEGGNCRVVCEIGVLDLGKS